jgi:hypothetical protein
MEVKVITLQKWYAIKELAINRDNLTDIKDDDVLHMLSKFLIQGIRAWGIFKNKGDGEHLSAVREVYETYKKCVYNPIFGPITHDDDKKCDIIHKSFDPSMKVPLKGMIDQMVNLYTGQTISYYPRNLFSMCPRIDTSTKQESVTFTDEAKKEFGNRMNDEQTNGKDTQRGWMTEWCQVFTGIFGKKPYFARGGIPFLNNPDELKGLMVGKIFQSGGKSTRRARTKKARRAKRHTRRAARREYRGR